MTTYARATSSIARIHTRLPCGSGPGVTGITRVPLERVSRLVQDLSAPTAYRHDRGQHRRIQSIGRHPRAEPTVDRDGAHLRVVTPQVNGIRSDQDVQTRHGLLSAGAGLGKRYNGVGAEAESGESEPVHREFIAWHIG